MPLHSERPIVRVEHSSIRTIETRNTENLFGLWSVFARCSPAMEDGKRYENMAWRLWSRETFCCQPDHIVPPQWAFERPMSSSAADVPELSTSVASDDSHLESAITSTSRSNLSSSRPDLRRHDSATSQARGRHMTPIGLEKVVNSIQEKKFIEPLSPLPPQLAAPIVALKHTETSTPRPASPPPSAARRVPESSTSTVATSIDGSIMSSAPVGSDTSGSTDMSHHSVVRGFEPGLISTSVRSSTNLNPTPILKKTSSFVAKPLPSSKAEPMKKKQPMFTLGGSSEEENSSSLEAYSLAQRSSLSEHMRKAPPPAMRKTTSFKNEVSTRTFQDIASESEGAIESDSEDEYDESAIEEDDSEDDWEDEDNEESGPSSVTERPLFSRVDSKPDLTSHRSLLTTALHQGDRATALQNEASRSSPAIRRSRNSTPNGPSTGNSPQEEAGLMMRQQASRPKPIIMTTSNVHPPAMSPKTTRRNMLQSELTGSLRQNLLWERQQKNATTNAVAKRQQSAVSLPALRRAMTTGDVQGLNTNTQQAQIRSTTFRDSKNDKDVGLFETVWDDGLQEYHRSGW
ncbi:hypothetical protein IAQ61_001308 [Plenodomus lingam]|uniref:Uncharacterized protein n=2 Tax=Leptosphaeria maculans TaxID=5022 RepID=E4ZXN5_LEPMJ|nr:hypothetical protein LEMA_P110490.1 [Plenodomus lingam JN3]ADB89939.1 dsp1-1 [Plenodomus lingam]KAH9879490.1 hypothetical protein IAQ61_001308 [Plenodomus lingam]CBX96130.1 hypothetical protein LEMA_P110490.1 [Plenodomus lingam JN3]